MVWYIDDGEDNDKWKCSYCQGIFEYSKIKKIGLYKACSECNDNLLKMRLKMR